MLPSEYDRVVCLSVDRRFRQETQRIQEMLWRHGVRSNQFRFFIDGDGTMFHPRTYNQITPTPPEGWGHGKGAYAHFCAMKQVIREAKADHIENLLWVEDDCVFTDDFDDRVGAATEQLRQGGYEWDLLYYGANHSWATTYEVTPNVLRCYGSLTTHCMGIPARTFDAILKLPAAHVIDKMIADSLHHRERCFAIWPAVAVQKPGYSYLSNANMDYSHYFKSKGTNHCR